MLEELKKFAVRGNVVDMAVGIVIGAAFTTIVKSLVDDVLMPPIGMLLGGVDFQDFFLTLRQGDPAGPYATIAAAREAGAVVVGYGLFANAVLHFLIVAVAVFMVTRSFNRLKREKEEATPEPTTRPCPECLTEIPIEARRCSACTSPVAAT